MYINENENIECKNFNWSILFVMSLVSIVMGIYRDGFAVFFPFLQKEFDLTRAQIGLYVSFLYFSSSFVSVFTGRLVDLKGVKWGMVSGTLLVGILLILHSIAQNFLFLLVLAVFSGFGMSINAPAANKGISEWFPQKWRSTATGIWSTAFPIGGLLAASLLPFLGILLGWRKAIIFPGTLALSCTFLILTFYHDKRSKGNNIKKNEINTVSFWKGFGQLVNNIDLLALSIYGFFWGAVSGAISTHFTLFLFLDYGLSESIAGLGFAFVQFGSILGRPGWGVISDRLLGVNRRKAFLFMGFLFFIITLILGIFLKNTNPSLVIIFLLAFLVGCTGRGWNGLFFSSVPEMVRKEQIGGAIGLSLFFARVGILLAPPIFGYIADFKGTYDLSWLLLGLIMLLASIIQYLLFYVKNNLRKKKNK